MHVSGQCAFDASNKSIHPPPQATQAFLSRALQTAKRARSISHHGSCSDFIGRYQKCQHANILKTAQQQGARPHATAQLLAISPSSLWKPRLSVQGGRSLLSPSHFASSPLLASLSHLPAVCTCSRVQRGPGTGSTRSRVRDEVPATLLRVLVCHADLLRLSRPCMSATRYRVMVQYRSQVFRYLLRLDLRTTHQPSLSGKCTSS